MAKPTPSTKDPSKPSARAAGQTVDEFVAAVAPEHQEVVAAARNLVDQLAPEASCSIKWAQPVWEFHGPAIWLKAFKNHTSLGFWRGAEMQDHARKLQGDGDRMRHLKLRSLDDVTAELFAPYVTEALELNRLKGDPSKRK